MERRIVAQLLTCLDGKKRREKIGWLFFKTYDRFVMGEDGQQTRYGDRCHKQT